MSLKILIIIQLFLLIVLTRLNLSQRFGKELKMKKALFRMVILLSLMLTLSACGGGNKAKINVELTDTGYVPAQFTVPAGAEVTLVAKSTGLLEHEFAIMNKDYKVEPPFGDKDEFPHLLGIGWGCGRHDQNGHFHRTDRAWRL